MTSSIKSADEKLFTPKRQIAIRDKVYTIDDSQATFIKINNALKKDSENLDAVFELAFGKENAEEIKALNLSVEGTQNLLIYVFAAIKGCEFEEAEKFFRLK